MVNSLECLEVIDVLTECRDELQAFGKEGLRGCSTRLKRMRLPGQWGASRLADAHRLAVEINGYLGGLKDCPTKQMVRKILPLVDMIQG
jgi:hypothetical protein